jgi:hypothetical protein
LPPEALNPDLVSAPARQQGLLRRLTNRFFG